MGNTSAADLFRCRSTLFAYNIADEVYGIGEAQASSSYLNQKKMINLAKKIKAQAIHSGYGFFSRKFRFYERRLKMKGLFSSDLHLSL